MAVPAVLWSMVLLLLPLFYKIPEYSADRKDPQLYLLDFASANDHHADCTEAFVLCVRLSAGRCVYRDIRYGCGHDRKCENACLLHVDRCRIVYG